VEEKRLNPRGTDLYGVQSVGDKKLSCFEV
jgi:hypothetical protein